MRYSVIVFVTLFATAPIASLGQVEPAQPEATIDTTICTQEIDEFTQHVKIDCPTQSIRVETSPDEPLYRSNAVLAVREGTTSLHIGFSAESWNFLSADRAYGIIDGGNMEWKLHRVSTETEGGSIYEEHAVVLNDSQLRMLASSDTLRMKLNGAVFDLSETNLNEQARYILENK